MRDKLDELIERNIAYPGATQVRVWAARDGQYGLWEGSLRSGKRSRDEISCLSDLVDRAGRILHYFHHGYLGGNFTADDEALLTRIKALPPN